MARHRHGHMGKAGAKIHENMKPIKGDSFAHSSHHANHGEGDQKGMHGFGPAVSQSPMEYEEGEECGPCNEGMTG